jgi:hypothetical protein
VTVVIGACRQSRKLIMPLDNPLSREILLVVELEPFASLPCRA